MIMSKWDQITTFIHVVEAQGFAAAAKKQGLSTAAISRQINRLESTLNVKLLYRSTRKTTLTEIGLQYYEQAKKALEGLNAAEREILGNLDACNGLLRVISNRYFAMRYLIPRLAEFMRTYPNLRIKLDLAERFPTLADEELDLIFGVAMPSQPNLVQRKVATTRYVLCASPAYLKINGTPVIPSDLLTHHYIAHSARQPNDRLLFKDHNPLFVKPNLWLNDSNAMYECALLGLGIVMLHDYVVIDALKDGRLIELLGDYQEPTQSVYLYYQQNKYLDPKIRRFIDFFVPF